MFYGAGIAPGTCSELTPDVNLLCNIWIEDQRDARAFFTSSVIKVNQDRQMVAAQDVVPEHMCWVCIVFGVADCHC